MLIKCACNNCSTHLEFESGNEGEIITCPSCNLETKLYAPPPTPVAQKQIRPIKPPPKKTTPSAVEDLRHKSSYPYLRSLIGGIYMAHLLIAALLGALGFFVLIRGVAMEEHPIDYAIAFWIASISAALLLIVIGKIWKELSSLFVDIADCQIHLVNPGNYAANNEGTR